MKLCDRKDIPITGSAAVHTQILFSTEDMEISWVEIQPRTRVPAEGDSAHETDEYCMFFAGEIRSGYPGGEKIMTPGTASFFEAGLPHWCANEKDVPCKLLCVMRKK